MTWQKTSSQHYFTKDKFTALLTDKLHSKSLANNQASSFDSDQMLQVLSQVFRLLTTRGAGAASACFCFFLAGVFFFLGVFFLLGLFFLGVFFFFWDGPAMSSVAGLFLQVANWQLWLWYSYFVKQKMAKLVCLPLWCCSFPIFSNYWHLACLSKVTKFFASATSHLLFCSIFF